MNRMTESYARTGVPGKEELLFLPLGGSGEIGMNLNLYGHDGRWLMVDFGITFGGPDSPGIDVILPDPTFIEERADRLAGLVLTHAHEDHLGAVPYLWTGYDCPVYATPFTAGVLRRKLADDVWDDVRPRIIEVPLSGRVRVGPFEVQFITLTHSIPEANALMIRTPVGNILHTGDWKLDPEPLVGAPTDERALRNAGDEGVLAMVCDSTNAMIPGHSESEGEVREALGPLIGSLKGRVAVACFASNVARLQSLAEVARETGRRVALVGRSLWRIQDAAREAGYLKDFPPFLTDREAVGLDPNVVLLVCTGSQGEPRAALTRISRGDHPVIRMGDGDTVVFSSREIPGNQTAIGQLQNQLSERGVRVITAGEHAIHASGHPNQDELTLMYQWVRPKISVPVHGEYRHMQAQAALARACQVPSQIVPRNGAVIVLTGVDGPMVIDQVTSGRLAVDGERIIPLDSEFLRVRGRLNRNGLVVVSIALARGDTLVTAPMLSLEGLAAPADLEEEREGFVQAAAAAFRGLSKADRKRDAKIRDAVTTAVRRRVRSVCGKRPEVVTHVLRV